MSLLNGCGTQEQQAPKFEQVFGAIDSPCAVKSAAAEAAQSCTSHVLIRNVGGDGLGHATIVIPLEDARAGSATSPIKCGRSIPLTVGGGHVDLRCGFELPAGRVIAGIPTLQSIDYTAAAAGSAASPDLKGLSFLVLAIAVLLLAAATAISGGGRRSPSPQAVGLISPEAAKPAAPPVAPPGSWEASHRYDPESEFKIPPLPR